MIARSKQTLYYDEKIGRPGDGQPIDLSSSWEKDLSAQPTEPNALAKITKKLHGLVQEGKNVVVVDNTSSEKVAYHYPIFLAYGISVVTPNKKAFSGPLELWHALSNTAANGNGSIKSGSVFHESTVGAGLPIISSLNDLVKTGDTVMRIQGVFSGTLSFLFNQFMPGRKSPNGDNGGGFSEEVCAAKALGYTEPDPREDLNGLDVARKLTILARIVGLEVQSATSFPVQSLVPKEIEDVDDGDKFIKGLESFDGVMAKRKEKAEQEDKVLRFVGSIEVETKDIRVGLERLVFWRRYSSNCLIVLAVWIKVSH